MTKYIIREVAPEQTDFSFYFDGDCFKGSGDNFKHNLFIRMDTRRGANFNTEDFDNIIQTAYEMQEHLTICKSDIPDIILHSKKL